MPRSSAFGSGKTPRSAWPLRLMRLAGITLFGNGSPVSGSRITMRRPFESIDCEKSPARSSEVGVVTCCSGRGLRDLSPSNE